MDFSEGIKDKIVSSHVVLRDIKNQFLRLILFIIWRLSKSLLNCLAIISGVLDLACITRTLWTTQDEQGISREAREETGK